MQFIDIDAREVSAYPTAIRDLLDRKLTGLVVHGVFDRAAMEAAVSRVERGECRLPRYDSEHFTGATFARSLTVAGDDLAGYFRDAEGASEAVEALFGTEVRFEARIMELVRALWGQTPTLAQRPNRQNYAPVNLRELAPGGEIGTHCEAETVGFPGMREIAQLIDGRRQLSFYVPLRDADTGGELVVYDAVYGEPSSEVMKNSGRTGEITAQAFAGLDSFSPRAAPGDLLIFDAGRHYHRVSTVRGSTSRWTIGGFLGATKDGSGLVYWS